ARTSDVDRKGKVMKLIRGTLATVAGFALATSAFGGPNQGGIVIAHVSEGLVYTDDSTGYCGQSTLEDCKDADARIDGTDVAIFHILAAFGGTPRFSGTTIGIDYDPEEIILVDWGVCGDFELPTEAWPEPGTGVAVTWAEAQLTRVTEIYWFAAYSYTGSPSEFVIGPHPHRGIEPFFADDDIPSNLDVAIDTGTLGFNMDGYQPCAPERACAIELSPANITAYKPCGGTIPIDLNVIDANFLDDFAVCVGFDPNQLVYDSDYIDPIFLGSTGRAVTPVSSQDCNPFYFDEGRRLRALTSGTQEGASGSGRLARIRFSMSGPATGVTPLGLDSWVFSSTDNPQEPMYVEAVTGTEVTFRDYCFGDYNGDGDVTAFDLAQVVQRWPRCEGTSGYDARYDVNLLEAGNFCASAPDGCIDVVDAQSVAGRWHLGCGPGALSEATESPSAERLVEPSLRIAPAVSILTADVDDTTSIALAIDDAADLGAFQAELTFDPAVLRVSDTNLGSLLSSNARTPYALGPLVDNEAGTVLLGGCTTGLEAGATGSGVLTRVVFDIVDCEATTTIGIGSATVTNVAGDPLELAGTTDGSIEIHCATTDAPVPHGITGLSLSIRPNPLTTSSEIAFSVPASEGGSVMTRLELFDTAGRRVRTLLHEALPSGPHSVVWDARDEDGRSLPGGAFFCRLQVGNETIQRPLVLTR
ncbi:MAG: hypothetical protein KDA27_20610, partial [Candidatus Eisenbacteria bacterium]|nr:hypothetical protein [Candidatus Eisenbacteria bacterium]